MKVEMMARTLGTCFLLGKLFPVQGCPGVLMTVFWMTIIVLRVFLNIHEVTTVIMPIIQISKQAQRS